MSGVEDVTWDRWNEVDALFAEALDRPPEDRPAFLRAACGSDKALLRAVEALLEAGEGPDPLPERPGRSLTRAALTRFLSDAPKPPEREDGAG